MVCVLGSGGAERISNSARGDAGKRKCRERESDPGDVSKDEVVEGNYDELCALNLAVDFKVKAGEIKLPIFCNGNMDIKEVRAIFSCSQTLGLFYDVDVTS